MISVLRYHRRTWSPNEDAQPFRRSEPGDGISMPCWRPVAPGRWPETLSVSMDTPQIPGSIRFLKLYGIIMAVDLLLYVLIFYVSRAIPPSSPFTSYPGNYGLCLGWVLAHFPAGVILFSTGFPESWWWLLIFQDMWLAAVIFVWRRRKFDDA